MTSNGALTRTSIKRGISLEQAAEGLRAVVMEGERVANGAAGRGLTELRNDYLRVKGQEA
ncbi:MAG: hypothetical protein JNK12_08605 [Acidimicrobiales bacterium]|nr:hypothetical protein [Acidimicrobiales bacterium]